MKLEDCKPGVRVRVYDAICGVTKGTISEVEDKPEIMYAFDNNGDRLGTVLTEDDIIDEIKLGHTVWLMRGVKKL